MFKPSKEKHIRNIFSCDMSKDSLNSLRKYLNFSVVKNYHQTHTHIMLCSVLIINQKPGSLFTVMGKATIAAFQFLTSISHKNRLGNKRLSYFLY
jgi:hypothetical protein